MPRSGLRLHQAVPSLRRSLEEPPHSPSSSLRGAYLPIWLESVHTNLSCSPSSQTNRSSSVSFLQQDSGTIRPIIHCEQISCHHGGQLATYGAVQWRGQEAEVGGPASTRPD